MNIRKTLANYALWIFSYKGTAAGLLATPAAVIYFLKF